MIIRHLDEKKNSNTFILFSCDRCGIEYRRITKSYHRMMKNELYDQDYCVKCWKKRVNSSESYRRNMSKAIQKMYLRDPGIKDRISASLRKSGANIGSKNGMKDPAARKKVSLARKKMFSDPNVRKHYSEKVKEAWARGDFDGVRTGQCSWHVYKHSNGNAYKVQGTWELAFIQWLDDNAIGFQCHKGRIPYVMNGEQKNYYPDFWVDKWNSYVDVKCRHFYSEEKFQAIRSSNPNMGLRVLFKDDLVKLGVKL